MSLVNLNRCFKILSSTYNFNESEEQDLKEKYNEIRKIIRKKQKEKLSTMQKEYYIENKQKYKEYYTENKQKIKEYYIKKKDDKKKLLEIIPEME